MYSPRLSSFGKRSYLKTFPFKSEALATTFKLENMKENTLPPFFSMERIVAGRPCVVLSKAPETIKPSFIKESVISDTETLLITNSLDNSARDMSLFLSASSTLSLFIFLALSGLEKSIEAL